MSENAIENNQGTNSPSITFNAQYLKDLSFEIPNAPQIFSETGTPDVTINVDVKAMKIQENAYSVSLILNAESRINGKIAFICECDFCGIVSLNVPENELEAYLLIEVPRYLFPFARNIMAFASTNGNFSPLLLNPIDFRALYEAKKQQQQA